MCTQTLDWTDVQKSPTAAEEISVALMDVIIAADVNYYTNALEPLVATLDVCLKPGGPFLLASRLGRISLDPFHELLALRGYDLVTTNEVDREEVEGDEDIVHCVWLYRRTAGASE